MSMTHLTWLLSSAAMLPLAVGACAEGIEPPSPTAMASIPAGSYAFGLQQFCAPEGTAIPDQPSCTQNTGPLPVLWPQLGVTLPAFRIDVHEVTNIQYEYCVADGGCTDPRAGNAQSFDQLEYYDVDRFNNFPVVNITQEQAAEYCAFVGRRLPTEFEWERAAKGADASRRYPADALDDDIDDCKALGFNTGWCRGDQRMDAVMVTDVDFVDEGGTRIYQLFGNAAEWTSTPYERDIQCEDDPPCSREEDCLDSDLTCKNDSHNCPQCPGGVSNDDCYYMCAGESRSSIVCDPYDGAVNAASLTTASATRVVRGGSVFLNSNSQTCLFQTSYRDTNLEPTANQPWLGFRCAADAP